MEQWELPPEWEWKTLADVSTINPARPRIVRSDAALTSFVPMQAVDEVQGKIVDMQTRPYGEIKRGYTYFEDGDVLLAKITPSMENGKAAIASGLIDGFGFGTTEFHVFRPHECIAPEWLFHFLRRKAFRGEAKANFRGAVGQQRVPEDFLTRYAVPIPYPDAPARSLAEQWRIVTRLEALLGEVRELRQLQAEIEADVGRLMEAVLAEVFDDRHKRPTVPLGDVFTFRSELIRPNDGTEGDLKFVGLQHIESGTGIKLGEDRLDAKKLDGRKFRFSPGQVLYGSLRPYLNKVWIADCEGICSVDQFVLCPDSARVDTGYLAHYLRSKTFLKAAQERASALDLPRIRRDRLVLIDVPIPSLTEQQEITQYLNSVLACVAELKQNREPYRVTIEQLEQSMLALAFRREL